MVFAPFLILFECTHSIFNLVEFSRFLRISIVGFTTFKANFQVWTNFWVPSTLFFQNTLLNLSLAKNAIINLHFAHMYSRFCDFFKKNTNLCCQLFHSYYLKFPLLLLNYFIIVKYDICAFKRTFNRIHSSPTSWDITNNISNVHSLLILFKRFHMCKKIFEIW